MAYDPWAPDPMRPVSPSVDLPDPIVSVWPRNYGVWNRANFDPETFGRERQEPGFTLYRRNVATRVSTEADGGSYIEVISRNPDGDLAGPPYFDAHVKIPLTGALMTEIADLLHKRAKAALEAAGALEASE